MTLPTGPLAAWKREIDAATVAICDLTALPMPPSWTEQALCAQADPEAWFPYKGESANAAKRICARCPVRVPCLDYALAHGERFGVWGGLSERERRQVAAARRAAA